MKEKSSLADGLRTRKEATLSYPCLEGSGGRSLQHLCRSGVLFRRSPRGGLLAELTASTRERCRAHAETWTIEEALRHGHLSRSKTKAPLRLSKEARMPSKSPAQLTNSLEAAAHSQGGFLAVCPRAVGREFAKA